jgi:hypothetical protein
MTKFLTVLAAGGAVALASIAAPTAADARCRGCGVGIAAGVIGGIAAGAAIAGAASSPYSYGPGYAYDPGYAYPPAYAYEGPAYYGGGYGYYGYRGGATTDYTNADRQLQGTR